MSQMFQRQPRPPRRTILVVNAPNDSIEDARSYFSHWGHIIDIQHAFVEERHRFLITYAHEDFSFQAHMELKANPFMTNEAGETICKLYVIRSDDLYHTIQRKPRLTPEERKQPLPEYTPPEHPSQAEINRLTMGTPVPTSTGFMYPSFLWSRGICSCAGSFVRVFEYVVDCVYS
ncbi:hypothetical protein GEMRC1_002209 [Eukaryota sp. GEM-RC1]